MLDRMYGHECIQSDVIVHLEYGMLRRTARDGVDGDHEMIGEV